MATEHLDRIKQWHTDEGERLKKLHESTGDLKARSKARWHWEALRMIEILALDSE